MGGVKARFPAAITFARGKGGQGNSWKRYFLKSDSPNEASGR